ncbi:hypothetical protein FUA23_03425 [Neolewinella aurantiaca]|uniref:Secreted protein (Por secretion system target) n=1 Tax=Neolewinella aurantiaca TaxID=2602767 RepID=A0A5C7FT65_9BACT|nr:hypothetical protein [Neolewinella aurantiaca]TXF91287.1 hypothetical protein FUA23_03425 [Neolewinella aurantiaca]
MKVFTTFLILILATASAFASIDPQDLTVQRDVTSGTIVMRSTVALSQAASFEITDAFGNVVYVDSVAKGDFVNKRFKEVLFSGNTYNIIVTDKMGKTTLPLKMNAKYSIAKVDKATHLVYPTMNFKSDRTMVVAYTNKTGKRVDIKIANDKGETVFTDQVSGPEDIRRAYQLDQLQSGAYQLIVSSGDVKNHTTAFALQ